MSDDKPVPETLQSIADKIGALGASMNAQFAQIDKRFAQIDTRFAQIDTRFAQIDTRFAQIDTRFDELKAQLRTEIESVRGDVKLVAEALAGQQARNEQNDADHRAFTARLDAYGGRILALEKKSSA
jgi:chromosome segregation ATPase